MNYIQKNYIMELLRNSHFVKVLLIGFIVLLFQIPISKIKGVIEEREQTREEAINEVTSKWGKSQVLTGPSIIVPYMNRFTTASSRSQSLSSIAYATFLPESLKISGNLESQLLYRGIYKIPVYTMLLNVSGSFKAPDFSEWAIDAENILWDKAYLSLQVTDAWAMTKSPILSWNNKELNFLPGAGEFEDNQDGLHVKIGDLSKGDNFDFSFSVGLNGSVGAFFVPFGRDTEVQLSSDWGSPSFQGTWLPTNRSVSSDGFKATWNIPFLSRNFPQKWLPSPGLKKIIESSGFGVEMNSSIDHYRMSQRSVKYQFLFLVLTFSTLWLFEVLAKIRVHPIQYLLIGSGMCLFYLLELSLAEHFGFVQAYSLASAAVVILVASYSAAVLKARKRAVIVGAVVTLLYIYLYILLMIESYALLAGSVGLFVALAAIMFLTRKVDWYSLTDTVISKASINEEN